MSCLDFSSRIMGAALLILAGAYAEQACSQSTDKAAGNGIWSSQLTLSCGKHKMTLTTSCREQQEDDTPLCPTQEIHMEGAGGAKVT